MSRLDDHVSAVRNRLALQLFITTLAKLSVAYAAVIWIAVLMDRVFVLRLPRPMTWFYSGLGAIVVTALAFAIHRRPSARAAAVPIDQKLGLKEKISTALFIRPSNDPFALAAVQDAEQSAQQVVLRLNEHFPLGFPKPVYATCAIALAAIVSYKMINPDALFGRAEQKAAAKIQEEKVERATVSVKQALAKVESMPVTVDSKAAIELAKAELATTLGKAAADPEKATRTAVRAMQDLNEALSQQMKNNAKYAQAQNEMKMMRSMQKPAEGQGPVADAHRAISEGKFTEALDDLEKAVTNFDKMDKEDQKKAADQMKQLAQQLQQMANNPAEQKKMEQQLQQMGMNQQQAQQAMQQMQQAAQGDKQAQQQLQQMAQQAMQQAGLNQQQQQQMQQQLQQMQAQANAQNQAQQMQQAAQQIAQAMQQAAQNQQGQPQQANQQGQPQQGQNPGQGQQGQQGQGMQQAMAGMQQTLQQMQAAAQDAQQIAAAQQAAAQGQANAQQAMNGAQGGDKANMKGNQQGQNGNGKWNDNNNRNFNGPNNGMAGGGVGAGDRTQKAQAPFGVQQVVDPSQDNESGRIIASNFIKDNNPLKGKSSETLKEIAEKAQTEQTDEIDTERVGRQAQNAVKQYFNTVAKEDPKQ